MQGNSCFALWQACEAYASSRARLLGHWGAWREFCAEVGVDPEAVMRASWGTVPNWISEPALLLEMDEVMLIKPDPEAKASALDLFMTRWGVYRERLGAGGAP